MQQEFRTQGVQVLAINTAPWIPVEAWRDYWREKGAADVSWVNDVDRQIMQTYKVTSLGTTIIIDRQGDITYRDAGATPYEVLRSEIEKTL